MAEQLFLIQENAQEEQIMRYIGNKWAVVMTNGVRKIHPIVKSYVVKGKYVLPNVEPPTKTPLVPGGNILGILEMPIVKTTPWSIIAYIAEIAGETIPEELINSIPEPPYEIEIPLTLVSSYTTINMLKGRELLSYNITITYDATFLEYIRYEAENNAQITVTKIRSGALNFSFAGGDLPILIFELTDNAISSRNVGINIDTFVLDMSYTRDELYHDNGQQITHTVTDYYTYHKLSGVQYSVEYYNKTPMPQGSIIPSGGYVHIAWPAINKITIDENGNEIGETWIWQPEFPPIDPNDPTTDPSSPLYVPRAPVGGGWQQIRVLHPAAINTYNPDKRRPTEFERLTHILVVGSALSQTVLTSGTSTEGGGTGGTGGVTGAKDDAWQAFDGDYETGWESAIGAFNPATGKGSAYIQMDLGAEQRAANYVEIANHDYHNIATGFRLLGSNDGVNWMELLEIEARPPVYHTDISGYYFDNTDVYRYYQLEVTEVTPNAEGSVSLSEFALFAYSGAFIRCYDRGLAVCAIEATEVSLEITAGTLYITVIENAVIDAPMTAFDYAEVTNEIPAWADTAIIKDAVTTADDAAITYPYDNTYSAGDTAVIRHMLVGGEESCAITYVSTPTIAWNDTAVIVKQHTVTESLGLYQPTAERVSPTMTSDTDPAPYVVSASSYRDNRVPWRAFDQIYYGKAGSNAVVSTDGWCSATVSMPGGVGLEWLMIDIPYVTGVSFYKLRNKLNDGGNTAPNTFTFEGSMDAVAWDVLDTVTGRTETGAGYDVIDVYHLSGTVYYRYYRFVFTRTNGGTSVFVGQVELWRNI